MYRIALYSGCKCDGEIIIKIIIIIMPNLLGVAVYGPLLYTGMNTQMNIYVHHYNAQTTRYPTLILGVRDTVVKTNKR